MAMTTGGICAPSQRGLLRFLLPDSLPEGGLLPRRDLTEGCFAEGDFAAGGLALVDHSSSGLRPFLLRGLSGGFGAGLPARGVGFRGALLLPGRAGAFPLTPS